MAFSSSNLDLTISVPSSELILLQIFVFLFTAKDLDMNRLPSPGSDDEWIASTMEVVVDEENTTNDGVVPRKKLRLSKEQSRLLEESFRQNHTLNPRQKEALASQLKLRPRQVEVWFQNRRARYCSHMYILIEIKL
ncbi:hypothetical protein Goklo_012235 [Gossypium klotzschianum]|uniref:Homeobox domain-containing protein n=1 Tax=Gossypium klotzschianum TaxID=34286 RepID=A0A7J8VBK9_9ROSI|nr:hypothetical protein [Gossypium klotzschianum]